MDRIERRFPGNDHQPPALLEAHVGGAMDEVLRNAVGDGSQGSHGTGGDHHAFRME